MNTLYKMPLVLVFVLACSSDNGNGDGGSDAQPGQDTGVQDTSTADNNQPDGNNNIPPPPTLGAQLDRMGRPAINTVGSKTFDANNRDTAENAYNANGDPTTWVAKHKADIAASIAILDALDAPDPNGCGNQAACGLTNGNMTKASGAYDGLATLLADDRLRVFTGGDGTCGLYLAVEANAALGVTNMKCGGRTPTDAVIAESYSLLSGAFDFTKMNPFLFSDGTTVDPALATSFAAGFPFFAPKH